MVKLLEEPWFWWSATLSGLVSAAVSNTPLAVYVLMGMMALDIGVGLLAAAVRGQINGEKAFKGALRKAAILGVVGGAALLQLEMTLLLKCNVAPYFAGVPTTLPFTEFVAGVFILYEFISILENAARAGVRLPDPLERMLAVGKEEKKNAPHQ